MIRIPIHQASGLQKLPSARTEQESTAHSIHDQSDHDTLQKCEVPPGYGILPCTNALPMPSYGWLAFVPADCAFASTVVLTNRPMACRYPRCAKLVSRSKASRRKPGKKISPAVETQTSACQPTTLATMMTNALRTDQSATRQYRQISPLATNGSDQPMTTL